MHLLIRAVSLAGQPLTQAISAYFDERGGTMGRSDTNTLALPDPERRISRLQAEVSRVPEGWKLINVGNANPIWHNNKAVAPGEAVLLDEGDELQVGTYSLHVSHAANDPAARTITRGRPAADARTVIVGSGLEARTDPSRMAQAQVSMVAHLPTQNLPTQMAPAGDGATRLVTGMGAATSAMAARAEGTQMAPHVAPPMPATSPTLTLAPQVPPPAAAPRSPFDDLLSPSPASAASTGAAPADSWAAFGSPAAVAAPASASSADPFADLLGTPATPVRASAPAAASAPAKLPDDFDPFADLMPASAPTSTSSSPFDGLRGFDAGGGGGFTAAPSPAAPAGGLQGFDFMGGQGGGVQGGATSSLDQMFGLSGGVSSADPLAAFMASTAPAEPAQAAVGAPSSLDPLALIATPPAPVVADTAASATSASPEASPEVTAVAGHAQALASLAHSPAALPDHVPEIEGLMPLPAAFDALKPLGDSPATVTAQLGTSAATSMATPTTTATAAAASDPASFDDLLAGLAASVPAGESPVTQPGPLTVQAVELPAVSALAQHERTVLAAPGRVVVHTEPEGHAAPLGAAVASDPLLSPSGELSLSDPSPFDDLLPHASTAKAAQAHAHGHADHVDPLLDFGAPLVAPVAAPVAPVTPATAPAAMAPLMPTTAAEVAHADTLALWSAFCQGAGVNFTPPQGLNPELMRVIGMLLRQSIDGTVKLVAARAATKQELRAEVTVIQAKGNNPLKFSPDAQSALEQLLQPPLRGFMAGPDAVADVMDDLLGHVIGTMVGTRAALEGVLQRFEPEQLEAKLVGRSVMDSLLPMNRRAKLWELYLQHYDGVRTEAQEDFHNLFGRAFLQAYEEQLDRLDAERRARKSA